WLLPEAIEDILPAEAARLEALRRRMLDGFRGHGYELVTPPLLEYVESLLTDSAHDLDLRTFKLVDQISGRTLGVRADITPQVARIDAHLLNRSGVTRLCYCANVLHTRSDSLTATREPLQIGAELYGHNGIEADIELIRLLSDTLALADLSTTRIDLGHVGIFRALVTTADLDDDQIEELFSALQAKDVPTLQALTADMAEPARTALRALPECYGDAKVLERLAALVPGDAEVAAAIADLRQLAAALAGLPISFDLADLRGYHYHSGVVFAAYCARHPNAIALGGRYDNMGKAFGRARPATGFSMDLREVVRLSGSAKSPGAILAPYSNDAALETEITRLRNAGEVVLSALPGHEGSWREAGCDRQLVQRGTQWIVEALN
ncbi:MAG TPA: ATP phosphoribosyltransferase regulatory subunit, partial [Rhodocyclaceae bacterium]|nr:ATP phosphoribosyltransferase regulatory subunit [Rhodocyclaceae bacterium]